MLRFPSRSRFHRLSFVLVPLAASLALAAETVELPSNLSPALRARLLAQNNTAEPETAPEVQNGNPNPAESTADPAAPGEIPAEATPVPPVPAPVPAPPSVPAPAANLPRPALPGAAAQSPGGPRRTGIPLPNNNNGRPPGSRIQLPGVANPAGGAPGGPQSAPAVIPDDPNDFLLAFTGSPIEDVVQTYELISGHHVIRDANLTGNVVVVQNPNKKMTREEAMEFIRASLLIQGYSLQDYKPGVDKIIQISAKPPLLEPSLEGAPIYMSAEDLPQTDEPVNYLIRLNYLSATEASPVFANAVPIHTWGLYTPIPSANAILVRGAVPNIRTLIKIKDQIDVEPVLQVHEFVELERASAEDIQALLDGILQAQTQANTGTGGGTRSATPQLAVANLGNPGGNAPQPLVAGGPGTSTGVMPDGKSVIVKADPRTNRIFINGPKVHVEYLKKLIREFDQPSRVKNLLTLQLRYVKVDEFLDIAASSLEARGLGASGQAGGAGGSSGSGSPSRTGQTAGQNQFGGFGNRGGFGQNQFGGGGGGFGGSGIGSNSSARTRSGIGTGGGASQSSVESFPRSQVVGKTLLISDPRMNTLLVTGPPESIERVSELVKEMDRRPMQVHINAVIGQITLGDDITTGFDLLRRVEDVRMFGQNVSIAGLYSTTGGNTFLDPANLDTVAGFTSAAEGLNLYGTVGELFNAYVRALETTSRFKVVSRPHIATANNQPAEIAVGSRVPIPSNQQSSIVAGGTTAVTSNIEYEDVQLILSVTPLINSKNEITIVVSQQNDTVSGSTIINGNNIPNILTQSLTNTITVPNGGIFTLGGSMTESKTQTIKGLPFISKIPVVKHLFGTTVHGIKRQELLIMLQPRIIDSAADMVDVHASEVQRTVIGPEAENYSKPDRDSTDVILPSYEKDIPFDAAGYPNNIQPAGKSLFKRIRERVLPQ